MDELPAYSWHGSDHRSVERKGGDTHTHTHWNIDTNGVGCWLGGGSLVGSSLDFCRYAVDVYSSAGIGGRAKQIFGAKPLKTRDQPTDELICFPCDAAFFVFFFPSFLFFPPFFHLASTARDSSSSFSTRPPLSAFFETTETVPAPSFGRDSKCRSVNWIDFAYIIPFVQIFQVFSN